MKKILITALLSCLTLQNLYATKMWVMNATGIPLRIDYKTNQSLGKFLAAVPSKVEKVAPGKIRLGDWVGSTLEAFKIKGAEITIPDAEKKGLFWGLEILPSQEKIGAFSYRLIKCLKTPPRQIYDALIGTAAGVLPAAVAGAGALVALCYLIDGKAKPMEDYLHIKETDRKIVLTEKAFYSDPLIQKLGEALQAGPERLFEKVQNLSQDKKTNFNVQFPDGDRPLHKIVELAPRIDIVKALLERKGKKADVNAKGMLDRKALQIAASKYPHAKLMDYLLEKGADRQAKDKFGSNVLHYIVTSPYLSFEDSAANINKLLSIKWATIDSNLMKMIDEKNKSKISPLEAARMQYAFSKSARQVKAAERYSKLIKYLEDIKKAKGKAVRWQDYK